MDAGEGSLGQLFRLFGSDEALYENIISSLKCIFVTHMHADHHLGIISILIERNRVETMNNCRFCWRKEVHLLFL